MHRLWVKKESNAIALERNIGTHADNRPPTVMHSQVDIQRYSVATIITKTSATEAISLNIIFTAYYYYYAYIIR